jgi:hypothetical protein
VYLKNKKIYVLEEALVHVSTVWIFNPRIFHMLFLLLKNSLCMNISAYPLVEIDDSLKVPGRKHPWVVPQGTSHLIFVQSGSSLRKYKKLGNNWMVDFDYNFGYRHIEVFVYAPKVYY